MKVVITLAIALTLAVAPAIAQAQAAPNPPKPKKEKWWKRAGKAVGKGVIFAEPYVVSGAYYWLQYDSMRRSNRPF